VRRWSVGTEHHARWSRSIAVLAVAVGVTVVGSPTTANAREVSPSAARADVPTATGLAPSSGPVAGGTAVTLTGANFVPGSTDIVVAFTSGGQVRIPASDVRVDSTGTAASFTTVAHPRAAGGQAGFFPTTPAGRPATPQVFTYVPGNGATPSFEMRRLPATGSASSLLLVLAVSAVTVGWGLVGVARKSTRAMRFRTRSSNGR